MHKLCPQMIFAKTCYQYLLVMLYGDDDHYHMKNMENQALIVSSRWWWLFYVENLESACGSGEFIK